MVLGTAETLDFPDACRFFSMAGAASGTVFWVVRRFGNPPTPLAKCEWNVPRYRRIWRCLYVPVLITAWITAILTFCVSSERAVAITTLVGCGVLLAGLIAYLCFLPGQGGDWLSAQMAPLWRAMRFYYSKWSLFAQGVLFVLILVNIVIRNLVMVLIR